MGIDDDNIIELRCRSIEFGGFICGMVWLMLRGTDLSLRLLGGIIERVLPAVQSFLFKHRLGVD